MYVSLDDDAWFLEPTAMVEAVRVMERDPKVAAVGFEILSPDCPQPSGKKGVEPAKMFIGCGHALRLKAVREVGGYEKMPGFYGGEEKDLCLRLMDRDWKIAKLNGVRIWHDKTQTMRDLKRQRQSGTLNDLTLIARRCPGSKLALYLIGNLINQIVFAFQKPGERLIPTLQGIALFFVLLPKIRERRAPIRQQMWMAYRSKD